MSELVTEFDWQAAGLLTGTSVLLVAGTIAVLFVQKPLLRQRLAELSITLTLLWFLMAVTPLPRVSLPWLRGKQVVPSATVAVAESQSSTQPLVIETEPKPLAPQPLELDVASASQEMGEPGLGEPGRAATIPTILPPIETTAADSAMTSRWSDRAWQGYLCVSVALLGCIVLGRLLLAICVRRSVLAPAWVQALYNELAPQRRATIRVSTRHQRPVSFGVFRPVILLPAFLCERSRAQALRHVLSHEQVHVDRRDAIGNTLMNMAAPFLWFHPLYWNLRSAAVFARELIADDHASNGTDKLAYVNDLLELIRLQPPRLSVVSSGMGVLGFRHPFTRRMSLLLNRNQPLESTMKRTSMITVCTLGLLVMLPTVAVLGTRASVAQETSSITATETAIATETAVDEGDSTSDPKETPSTTVLIKDDESFEAKGVAIAVNDLNAFSPTEGQVVAINRKPGEVVEKGDSVVRLQNLSLLQEASAMRQKLSQAANESSNEMSVRAAEQHLKAERSELERIEQLFKKNLVSKTQQQAQVAKIRIAEFELEAATRAVADARKLESELDRQYRIAQDRVKALEVRSPISGVIEELAIQPSAVVSTGAKLFRVIDLSKIRFRCFVPIKKFSPAALRDKPARIEFPVGNGSLQLVGKVQYVGSTVTLDGGMEVWIDCENLKQDGDWMILPGMLGKVVLSASPKQTTTAEPDNAWKPNPKSAEFAAEEVVLLKKLVEQNEATFRIAKLKLENGTGSVRNLENAGTEWWSSQAELAIAEGKIDDADAAYQKAISFASKTVDSVEQQLLKGSVDAALVLPLQRRATQIQLEYLRFKKRFDQ